ncbi:mitogen-activated protein kinase kinase kinase 7-like [Teleopsis dalmanni]|uniref:mitogen-activated protein kinase kinase kinase 7-like n=1 Tax=Teleopsis dalmanni TaxID=139649 RepID=UPI0018CE5253|nr:mitogen-activated protein kinase kinase kinase 7-like [Teleopsis dalmanni]
MCSARMSHSSQENTKESSNSDVQAFRMPFMPSGHIETPDTPCSGDYLSMQPFIDFEEIAIKEKCGHGSYGVVYKAVWRDRYVAVKEFVATAEQTAIEREVKQLSRVCHDNIISLYGISAHNQSKYLVMEYAEGGCLYNFLHGKVKPHYQPAHAISWALQCAKGVAYLHAMQPNPLIHRDLKPLNLLLTDKGRHLKICDFGTVADKSTMMTNNRGSAAWMAPEVFEGSKYTEKCDTFSWGIVLWEVLSRKQPFSEIDNSLTIMWKIHKGERPEINKDWPSIIQNLMASCWKTKPDHRPSMQNVVSEMSFLSTSYSGADEPLEYEFKDQQIFRTDSYADTDDCDDNTPLDFSIYTSSSNNNSSTQVTPTNTTSHSNSSSASTPTNVAATVELFNQHANMATPSITTTRWDVIKEEPETTTYDINDSADVFNLTPSAASAKRFETIRNDMTQSASVPMPPLSLEIDPHAWDLSSNNSNNSCGK